MQRLLVMVLLALALLGPDAKAEVRAGIVEQARTLVGDSRLVVLGEMHGTREVPVLVEHLVDAYSIDQPVLVALELSRGEQVAIDTYLRSDGSPADLGALLSSGYWYRPEHRSDGRRNAAVVELVEALRVMRGQGRDVAVLMFDIEASNDGSAARDRAMAAHLRRAFEALPQGRMLVVAGNVHAMRFKPDYCPQCQSPMTGHLRDLNPYSIDIQALSGSFIACRTPDTCGPMPVPVQTDQPTGIAVADAGAPFHAWLRLPRFTPADAVSDPQAPHSR